jgi:hypothetical protein
MSEKQSEDLDWLAFRYVAAELSGPQLRQFEQRLEHDQAAREAVGRVVEVTCAVRALDEETAPRIKPRRQPAWPLRRGVRWLAALAAGVALGLLVWGPSHREPGGLREGGLTNAPPLGELAVVWSTARTDWSPGLEQDGWGESPLEIAGERRLEVAGDAPAIVDMPDWMIVALVARESDPQAADESEADVEGI